LAEPSKPDVVLFASRFPYGESALRGELEVTAGRFGRLFIVPSNIGTDAAELPPNAVVVDLDWAKGWRRSEKLRALCSRQALRILCRTLRHRSNWRPYGAGVRTYLDILATQLLKAQSLEGWVEASDLRDAIFYDYWFENSTLALAVLRDRGAIRCAVSRAHGFDLFDYRWGNSGRVPFREYKAEFLDAIFAVSEIGADYLRRRIGDSGEKVRLARLGVPLPPSYPRTDADPPLVVSCSMLLPLKRAHLIPAVLEACDRRLRWVHFGEGAERGKIEAAAASLPDTIAWELKGWVDNSELRDFYATQPVSAFLSLSKFEGIPVSMMEAQSFGVPIVGPAVGGVPELVPPEAGVLLPAEASVAAFGEALAEVLDSDRFDPDAVRAVFAARFDAAANYGAFADALLSLRSGGAVHA
jgi:glycosyltransferase involved in cell wall biosynthesis